LQVRNVQSRASRADGGKVDCNLHRTPALMPSPEVVKES